MLVSPPVSPFLLAFYPALSYSRTPGFIVLGPTPRPLQVKSDGSINYPLVLPTVPMTTHVDDNSTDGKSMRSGTGLSHSKSGNIRLGKSLHQPTQSHSSSSSSSSSVSTAPPLSFQSLSTPNQGPSALRTKEGHLLLQNGEASIPPGTGVIFQLPYSSSTQRGKRQDRGQGPLAEGQENEEIDTGNMLSRLAVPPLTSALYIERAENRLHLEIDDLMTADNVKERKGLVNGQVQGGQANLDGKVVPNSLGVNQSMGNQAGRESVKDGLEYHGYYEPAYDVERMTIQGDE